MENNIDFNKIPWTPWIVEGIKTLVEYGAEKIALCAILPENEVFSGYFNVEAGEKAIIAHNIHMDATMDTIYANIDELRDALNEEED
ncbi:MAG: hypothetical protein Q4F79_13155 [Eubacteriales bacterium]|nr:hypothetical protein [Eubacteriales bacterium]